MRIRFDDMKFLFVLCLLITSMLSYCIVKRMHDTQMNYFENPESFLIVVDTWINQTDSDPTINANNFFKVSSITNERILKSNFSWVSKISTTYLLNISIIIISLEKLNISILTSANYNFTSIDYPIYDYYLTNSNLPILPIDHFNYQYSIFIAVTSYPMGVINLTIGRSI